MPLGSMVLYSNKAQSRLPNVRAKETQVLCDHSSREAEPRRFAIVSFEFETSKRGASRQLEGRCGLFLTSSQSHRKNRNAGEHKNGFASGGASSDVEQLRCCALLELHGEKRPPACARMTGHL